MSNDKILAKLKSDLTEKFSTTWRLLSETTLFLSRTPLFSKYEMMLRNWRRVLESNRNNAENIHQVRQEIVALRKELRKQGYDLTLGRKDIKIEGYRNETAVREGFTRLVIAISEDAVYHIAGQDNHIQLDRYLQQNLQRIRPGRIIGYHYLWYRWRNNVLVLSGSDSEVKDEFERLKEFIEVHKLFMLKHLKRLG